MRDISTTNFNNKPIGYLKNNVLSLNYFTEKLLSHRVCTRSVDFFPLDSLPKRNNLLQVQKRVLILNYKSSLKKIYLK